MRTSVYKPIPDTKLFKQQLLFWAQQFREVIFMDSNDYPQAYSSYGCMMAVEAFAAVERRYVDAFEDVKQYQQSNKN